MGRMNNSRKASFKELVNCAAQHVLSWLNPDGSFPAGHNGPYHHPETPVRNTAHWLFLTASLFIQSGEEKWKEAGEKAIDFLKSPKARPHYQTFHCRDRIGFDSCNGLIGQAWVIEALVKASEAFDRQDCYELAEEVFLLHPWDENVGIWSRVEVDGTGLYYDGTFNHQLWFAAAGGMLYKTPVAQERVEAFLEKIAVNVQLYSTGIIFHSSAMGHLTDYLKTGVKPLLRETKFRLKKRIKKNGLYSKSVGYHGFNLYGFAILKKVFPNAPIWETPNFFKLLTAHRLQNFIRDVRNSEFGYRYNLAGIEIAFAVETFFNDKEEVRVWLNRQMEVTFLSDTAVLSRDAHDPNTAMARIYQAARFSEDYEVITG